MPVKLGALAVASGAALSVSLGLIALHYRRAMRRLQATLSRHVDADAEMLEGDARHRVLLDHAPIGCVVWEPGFRIVEWNRQAELIFGWRRDEAIGRHLIETLFREEDRAGMRRLATKLFAGAISQHGALAHVGRDGGTRVCEWHHAALRDPDGSPARIVSMCLDVTGVRDIERENALFRALIENTADPAVLLLDEEDSYRVRYANAAAARHLGLSVADLIGRVPSDWDRHADAQALAQYREAARKDGTITIETEHCRADGTTVPVEVTSNAIEHAGHAYVTCYVRDISRRRADEARLRALEVSAAVREHEKRHHEIFQHSSDALFSLDVSPHGNLTFSSINPAAEQALGVSAATLAGVPLDAVAAEYKALATHLDAYHACVKSGLPLEYEAPLSLSSQDTGPLPQYAIRLMPLAADAGIERIIGIGRDVTSQRRYEAERRLAAEALAAREREFRTLAENSPDHIARFAPDGRFLYLNPRMETAFGIPAAALLGRSPAEAFPDGRFDVVAARIQAAGRDGVSAEIEFAIPTAFRGLRHHNAVIVPERSADGGVASVLTVSRDVTEQKQTQRHMALLTFALNHMNDGSVLSNRDGRILNANRAFCAMLGYERSELIGRPIFDVSMEFTSANWQRHWESVLAKGGAEMIETVSRTKNGRPVPVEVSISLFDFEGETYNLAAVRDITERRRMQEALAARERSFRSLAENSPNIIARFDRDGRRLYVNGTVTRLCGMAPEALIGGSVDDGVVLSGAQAEKLSAIVRQTVVTGEAARDEIEIVDRDGVSRVFLGQVVPEFGPDGEVESVLSIGHDITAIRDAERLVSRFVNNMPGFAFTLHLSPEGHYSFPFASPGIRKLFGLRPEDVRNDMAPLHWRIQALDRLQVEARLETAARDFAPIQFEFRIAGPDGAERWIEVRGTPERDADGSILWHGVMLNVTKRKRMENDLRQREQEFRTLAENSPDPIVRYDPQGRRIFANRSAANLSRTALDVPIGNTETGQPIIPATDAEQVRRVIGTVVATGQPQECEIDFIRPTSGRRRVMQNRYVPEFGSYGRVVSVLSISRDITVLKETLDTLSHRERSLSEAQRMGGIGSWQLDLAENRLDWSDEVFRIFEVDQARFGASYEAFLNAIHPEDRDAVDAAYTRSLKTRTAYAIDHRLLMPDGRVKYVHERCETKYGVDGRPLVSRGTVQDVTERTLAAMALRQREQEFRTLAENSPDLIVRYDRLGRRTYVNKAYLVANRVANESVLGKTVEETSVFPPAIVAEFVAMLARVVAEAGNDELSMTWRRKDGQDVSYFLRAVPEFGDDGKVVSVLTVARDVTALKETERRLVESRAELQELTARREDAREEERRRIARDLHEELGQTLSALRMSISVLPLEYAEAAPELRPRTLAMLKLTDRALHGMRQAVMTLRPTALDAGIAAGLEWLAREFEEHAGLPCALRVVGDRIELDDRDATTAFRIAQEALTNVARHARARRADLTLRCESAGWLLRVRDNGRGFDPAVVHEKAFGLRSMTERALSIDGQLAVMSSPGRGTVVKLRISR